MEQKIKALLARIVHPESGRNIVESGMVEHIDAGEGRVTVTLRFEKARDPFALKIKRQVEEAIARLEGIDCHGKGTSCPDQLARALRRML